MTPPRSWSWWRSNTGRLHNGAGEIVDVESEFIYPLIKGTDLNWPVSARPECAWSSLKSGSATTQRT